MAHDDRHGYVDGEATTIIANELDIPFADASTVAAKLAEKKVLRDLREETVELTGEQASIIYRTATILDGKIEIIEGCECPLCSGMRVLRDQCAPST